jgi:hypothetical protein
MQKDTIQERIKLLEKERDQTRANLIAYEGALQEANYWLKQTGETDGGSTDTIQSS